MVGVGQQFISRDGLGAVGGEGYRGADGEHVVTEAMPGRAALLAALAAELLSEPA